MRSLRARVITFTLLVIGAVLVPLGFLSYHKAVQQFDELGDARLIQATRTIDVLAENAGLGRPSAAAPLDVLVWRSPFTEPAITDQDHAYEVRLGFQYWNERGRLQLTSDNFQELALAAAPHGFADITLADGRWRVFTLLDTDGDTVRVAERYDGRNRIANTLLWERLGPMFIALPILALLVGWAVRRALRPLDSLSRELATRQPDEARPITFPGLPRELEPVLASLNGLVNRAHAALDRERLFAADAAHQLRTPLAAALLHLENAAATESPELRAVALARAHEGLGRLQHLVNQFLELARWETAEREPARETVDLEACVRSEVEDAALLAADKDLDVQIVMLATLGQVRGWVPAVRALIRNLVDNAFRYTPAHGRVEVRVSANVGAVLLEVNDSGPGIPYGEREAVLKRFQRGHYADLHGSGLGLSIVCRIAHLHGATVELRDSRFESGLCVRVQFPADSSRCVSQPKQGSQSSSA